MFTDNLYSVEVSVGDKSASFVEFHFYLAKQKLSELKKEEVKIFSLCRSLLDPLFRMIEIIADCELLDVNKLARPSIKYGETSDKEHRYFEVMFTLGKVPVNRVEFQKFHFNVVLRANESNHVIEHGRFDFEFQALRQHHQYINVVEGYYTDEVKKRINTLRDNLALPLKTIIETSLGEQLSGIHLSEMEIEEFAYIEGDHVLVSSGILLGSPYNPTK